MELEKFAKQVGISPDTISKLNAKQGPGIVGKQTTAALGATAGIVGIGIVAASIHSLALFGIGGGFVVAVLLINNISNIVTAIRVPNQGMENVVALLDRHPEAILPYLTKSKDTDAIDGSFRDALDEGKKPRLLPHSFDEDSPDAPDKPETLSVVDSEEIR